MIIITVWIDKHNRMYIIFPVEEIEESLDVGHEKALNLLKELDDQSGIGLVKKKRRGSGTAVNFVCEELHCKRRAKQRSCTDIKKYGKRIS